MRNTFGMFDGVSVRVVPPGYLPDGVMVVNHDTWDKMSKWFQDNFPTTEMSEADKLRYATDNAASAPCHLHDEGKYCESVKPHEWICGKKPCIVAQRT